MLKSIEIWDFESHAHTLIDDISDGFNAIRGLSNSGKTSIIRALRLPAYNEFDPDSVRVGATKCRVKVVTDKGSVQVTRGPKNNEWEITPNGKPTISLDKVGVKPVPQAIEIIGMSMVKLGDVEIPVNIMDQLETHFMLSGIGDEKATGSVRAQIIDEISGLSGIEGIIKSVSLDNHRNGREIKQSEDRMAEIEKQFHDEKELQKEQAILDYVQELLKEAEEAAQIIEACQKFQSDLNSKNDAIGRLEQRLSKMPDLERAQECLKDASDAMEAYKRAQALNNDILAAGRRIEAAKAVLARCPDVVSAGKFLQAGEEASKKLEAARAIHEKIKACDVSIVAKQARIAKLGSIDKAEEFIREATEASTAIKDMNDMKAAIDRVDAVIASKSRELSILSDKLAAAVKEREEVLKTIKVCPISLGPVSEECLRGAQ